MDIRSLAQSAIINAYYNADLSGKDRKDQFERFQEEIKERTFESNLYMVYTINNLSGRGYLSIRTLEESEKEVQKGGSVYVPINKQWFRTRETLTQGFYSQLRDVSDLFLRKVDKHYITEAPDMTPTVEEPDVSKIEPKKTTWIIQTNGGTMYRRRSVEKLIEACEENGNSYILVNVNPLKPIPSQLYSVEPPFIIYGLDKLTKEALSSGILSKGLFYDTENFTFTNCRKNWGNKMLNNDAIIMDVQKFFKIYSYNDTFFIRPNKDTKFVQGGVYDYHKLQCTGVYNESGISVDTVHGIHHEDIIVATPKKIGGEYRFFIVDGEICSYCQYAPIIANFIPPETEEFVKQAIEEWSPSDAFVIDIAYDKESGNYKIVEVNGIQWAGLSGCKALPIVRAIDRLNQKHE